MIKDLLRKKLDLYENLRLGGVIDYYLFYDIVGLIVEFKGLDYSTSRESYVNALYKLYVRNVKVVENQVQNKGFKHFRDYARSINNHFFISTHFIRKELLKLIDEDTRKYFPLVRAVIGEEVKKEVEDVDSGSHVIGVVEFA